MIVSPWTPSYPGIQLVHRSQSKTSLPAGSTWHTAPESTNISMLLGLFTNRTDFSKHHDPLKPIIRVSQAKHIASTTGARIVCVLLPVTFTSKVSNRVAVVTSAFLLGVVILGFGYSFLDISCPCHLHCWFGINSFLRSDT